MSGFERIMIFKHLFNYLELATNSNDRDRTGELLDEVISLVTNLEKVLVREWRPFYNRTKHIDREPRDINTYIQGIEKLPSYLREIPSATKSMILERIKNYIR